MNKVYCPRNNKLIDKVLILYYHKRATTTCFPVSEEVGMARSVKSPPVYSLFSDKAVTGSGVGFSALDSLEECFFADSRSFPADYEYTALAKKTSALREAMLCIFEPQQNSAPQSIRTYLEAIFRKEKLFPAIYP